MGYFARERIYTGCGPNLPQSAVVFGVDDLTEEECRTLAASVQHYFDQLHEEGGHGPWFFELQPSAAENPAVFINVKSDWDRIRRELEAYQGGPPDSSPSELYWFYATAKEHAEIIRNLRCGRMPTVYLQCDDGTGFKTFDCVNSLTWDEIETLEEIVRQELHQLSIDFRIVSDWEAEREPSVYVKARLSWKHFEEDVKNCRGDESRMTASGVAYECMEEIRALRQKPAVFGRDDDNDDEPATETVPDQVNVESPQQLKETKADASLRKGYRDPDNYWRNVWLYEQRKAGKTNVVIRMELLARASEFEQLESDNALRTAIDSIAIYHGWPILKGKAGRPKSATRDI